MSEHRNHTERVLAIVALSAISMITGAPGPVQSWTNPANASGGGALPQFPAGGSAPEAHAGSSLYSQLQVTIACVSGTISSVLGFSQAEPSVHDCPAQRRIVVAPAAKDRGQGEMRLTVFVEKSSHLILAGPVLPAGVRRGGAAAHLLGLQVKLHLRLGAGVDGVGEGVPRVLRDVAGVGVPERSVAV